MSHSHHHTHDHSHSNEHTHDDGHDHHHHHHDVKIKGILSVIVLIIALITAVAEIYFGRKTGSRGLTSDGWHMLSHTWVLGLTGLAYGVIWINQRKNWFKASSDKILSLAGFISALSLMGVAIGIGFKSMTELIRGSEVELYTQALIVAVIGLVVNGLSAVILHQGHEGHDHNMRAAYLHLLADALTSFTAILALLVGHYLHWHFMDPIVGVLAAVIIGKWAYELITTSGKEVFRKKAG